MDSSISAGSSAHAQLPQRDRGTASTGTPLRRCTVVPLNSGRWWSRDVRWGTEKLGKGKNKGRKKRKNVQDPAKSTRGGRKARFTAGPSIHLLHKAQCKQNISPYPERSAAPIGHPMASTALPHHTLISPANNPSLSILPLLPSWIRTPNGFRWIPLHAAPRQMKDNMQLMQPASRACSGPWVVPRARLVARQQRIAQATICGPTGSQALTAQHLSAKNHAQCMLPRQYE